MGALVARTQCPASATGCTREPAEPLRPRASSGTYLNRELIGKGNSAHVKHGDRISLLAGVAGTRDGITFRFELLDHDEMLRISIKSPSTKSYRAGSSVHVDLSESWAVIEPHDTDLGVE